MTNKCIFFSLTMLVANVMALSGSQWMGPLDVFSTLVAQYPVVGVDADGNAVILAMASDDGSLYYEKGAQLIQGSIQNLHNFPPAGSNVGNEFIPVIAVNSVGNAIGLWTEYDGATSNDFIQGVVLTGNTWGNPTILTNPSTDGVVSYFGLGIALDDANSGAGSWIGNGGTTLEASQYTPPNWSAVQQVPVMANNPANQVLAGSSSGQKFLAWASYAPAIYLSTYNGSIWNSQEVSEDVYPSCHPLIAISINTQNNGMLVWNNASENGISSSFITGGVIGSVQSAYTPTLDESISSLVVATDNAGNALVLWISQIGIDGYQVMTNLYSAGSWGVPILLDMTDSGNSFSSPNIALDGFGNAYAVWEMDDSSENGKIYYSQYIKASNSWIPPVLLSDPTVPSSKNPILSMNQFGGAAVVWSISAEAPNVVQIVYTGNLKPASPTSFFGKQVKNKFLTQTDLVNQIHWSASATPAVVSYNVFSNGLLLATVPSTAPLVFAEHNCQHHKIYVYEVTAVDAQGVQSDPVTFTIY